MNELKRLKEENERLKKEKKELIRLDVLQKAEKEELVLKITWNKLLYYKVSERANLEKQSSEKMKAISGSLLKSTSLASFFRVFLAEVNGNFDIQALGISFVVGTEISEWVEKIEEKDLLDQFFSSVDEAEFSLFPLNVPFSIKKADMVLLENKALKGTSAR